REGAGPADEQALLGGELGRGDDRGRRGGGDVVDRRVGEPKVVVGVGLAGPQLPRQRVGRQHWLGVNGERCRRRRQLQGRGVGGRGVGAGLGGRGGLARAQRRGQ